MCRERLYVKHSLQMKTFTESLLMLMNQSLGRHGDEDERRFSQAEEAAAGFRFQALVQRLLGSGGDLFAAALKHQRDIYSDYRDQPTVVISPCSCCSSTSAFNCRSTRPPGPAVFTWGRCYSLIQALTG